MNVTLQIALLIFALVTSVWILRKVRRCKVKVYDAVFWVSLSFLLIFLGIVPNVSFIMADILGIQSPANFVFLIIIFLLLEKTFTLSIQVSQLEDKVENLTAEIALRSKAMENKLEVKEQDDNEVK